jgi:hypothetical protein
VFLMMWTAQAAASEFRTWLVKQSDHDYGTLGSAMHVWLVDDGWEAVEENYEIFLQTVVMLLVEDLLSAREREHSDPLMRLAVVELLDDQWTFHFERESFDHCLYLARRRLSP